jgi:hypothetical protein
MKDIRTYVMKEIKECKEMIEIGFDEHDRMFAFMDVLEQLDEPQELPHNIFDDMQTDIDNFFTSIDKVTKR